MISLQSSPAITRLHFTVEADGSLSYLRPANIRLFIPKTARGGSQKDALDAFAEGVIAQAVRGVQRRAPVMVHRNKGLTFSVYGPPPGNARKGNRVLGIVRNNGKAVGAVVAFCSYKHRRNTISVALGGLLKSVRGYGVYLRLLRVIRAAYRRPVQSGDKLSPAALRFWKRAGVVPDATWTFRLNPPTDGLWVLSTDLHWALPMMTHMATRKHPL